MNKVLVSLLLLTLGTPCIVQAQQKPASIWDDPSESNPYFKTKRSKTGADIKRENSTERKYYKSDFKRRLYTGPTPAEAAQASKPKAIENFKSYLPEGQYDVKFDGIDYNPDSDTLSIKKLTFLPRVKNNNTQVFPILTAENAEISGFNIGEIYGTPQNEKGRILLSKIQAPIVDQNGVKKGVIDFEQIEMIGKALALFKEKRGELETLSVVGMRSESISPYVVLANIVQSNIFSANRATFNNVTIDAELFESIKQQSLNGISFSSAMVNEKRYYTPAEVSAATKSVSARVFNAELVAAMRNKGADLKQGENLSMSDVKEFANKTAKEKEKLIKEMKK